jgi:hypothetical protein
MIVPVINATLSCLVINVEVLEVVVKVYRPCTEIAAKQSRVCSEDSGDI